MTLFKFSPLKIFSIKSKFDAKPKTFRRFRNEWAAAWICSAQSPTQSSSTFGKSPRTGTQNLSVAIFYALSRGIPYPMSTPNLESKTKTCWRRIDLEKFSMRETATTKVNCKNLQSQSNRKGGEIGFLCRR